MQENENPSVEQMRRFWDASQEVRFQAEGRTDRRAGGAGLLAWPPGPPGPSINAFPHQPHIIKAKCYAGSSS